MAEPRQPDDALVNWAAAQGLLHHALDRGWHYRHPPVATSGPGSTSCECGHQVEMLSFPCEDDTRALLGQCPRCERIYWSRTKPFAEKG